MVWKPCVVEKHPPGQNDPDPWLRFLLKTGLSFHQLMVIFPAKKSTSCCLESELPSAVAPLLLPGAVRARGRTAQRASHLQVNRGAKKKTGKTAAFANSGGGSHQKLSIQKKLGRFHAGITWFWRKELECKKILDKFATLGGCSTCEEEGNVFTFHISISTPYCCWFRNPACITCDVWKPYI